MLNILAFSDRHNRDLSGVEKREIDAILKNRNIHLVLSLGDNPKPFLEDMAEIVKSYALPIIAVRGNHDSYDLDELSKSHNIINLHRKRVKIFGVSLMGIEGAPAYCRRVAHSGLMINGSPDGPDIMYDDEGDILHPADYKPEWDYSRIIRQFSDLEEDGTTTPISGIPKSDILISHPMPIDLGKDPDAGFAHRAPKTLTKLLNSSQAPRFAIHGHLHFAYEENYRNNYGQNVQIHSVYTPKPFEDKKCLLSLKI